ncbi:hypothetical protein BGX33_005052 [Mortierella sp. NVP41]|nr:hypothetical protein BGX33_005052 [Mortierella sp. NVP41]
MTVPGNRMCWTAVIQVPPGKEGAFESVEWKSGSMDSTIAEMSHFKFPFGGTSGDIFNATPKELISKDHLEEKLFETWTHGRVALVGDGAINSMQDATIVANCIYDLVSLSYKDIDAALKDYTDQRFVHAKTEVDNSHMTRKLLYGQNCFEKLLRKMILGWMPKSYERYTLTKAIAYRPQATFLPRTETRGTYPVLPQKPSRRYEEEQQGQKQRVVI